MEVHVLPPSTRAVIQNARQKGLPVHAGLDLTKFVPWAVKDARGKGGKVGGKPEPERRAALKNVIESLKRAKQLGANWRARRGHWLERLGERARTVQVVTVSPCVLWLAAPTALEVGFCLHHTYGVPYLPGSGIKGLTRRYANGELGGSAESPAPEVREMFGEGGDEGRLGKVDFLDGIPLDAACLEEDVMTPHHHDYYAGKTPVPHDCEDPVPIPFLRIKVGATFEIGLVAGPRGGSADLARAEQWMLGALRELGLGGKTTSGYGLFDRAREVGAARSPADGGAGPAKAPAVGRREVAVRPVGFEKGEVVFADAEGRECRVGAAWMEQRFGLSRHGWRDRIRQEQRFVLTFEGEEIASVRQERRR